MSLFEEYSLTPEARQLIEENANLVNEKIYDWIKAEKKLRTGIVSDTITYFTIAKRRKNARQVPIKVTNSRRTEIERLVRMGYTKSDFVKVIDYMVNKWHGTEQEKYLTPDTIFRQSKFPKYHEEACSSAAQKIVDPVSSKLVGQIKTSFD